MRRVLWCAITCAALLVPSAAQAKKFLIDTTPVSGGRVSVNGQFKGIAPIKVEVKLAKGQQAVATAQKDGAVSAWGGTSFDNNQKGTVMVRLEVDDSLDKTINSDVANTWLSITPKHTMNAEDLADEDKIWQKLISVVSDNFSDLEQMDRDSYYLRTAWRLREFNYVVIRNRLVVKLGVGSEFTVKVRLESQLGVKNPQNGNWPFDDDYELTDRVFDVDKETVDFLRDQL